MSDCSTNAWKPPESLTDAYRAGRLEAENVRLRGLCRDMYGYLAFCATEMVFPFGGKVDEFSKDLEELGVEI